MAFHPKSFGPINLDLSINYELIDDIKFEHEPQLVFWLSQTISLSIHIVKLNSTKGHFNLKVEFEPVSTANQESIWTGNLNVDVWTIVRNVNNESARNQAGSLKIPLIDILDLCGDGDEQSSKSYNLIVPSLDDKILDENHKLRTDILNYKGKITLKCSHSNSPALKINGSAIRTVPKSLRNILPQIEAWKNMVYSHYMGSCVLLFKEIKSTWKVTDDINVYRYKCRAGNLPAAAFLCNKLAGTPPEYFINALRIVLKRHSLRIEEFNRKHKKAGEVLGEILCLVDNYMAYIPDIVWLPKKQSKSFEQFPLESFDLALFRGGGDCEDMALEICLEAAELAALEQDKRINHLVPVEQTALNELIAFRKLFIFTVSLGAVSSAEINGDYAKCDADDFGAHMWSIAVPCWLWFEMWARGNGIPTQLEKLFRDRIEQSKRIKYPMILEGTGFLEPESYCGQDMNLIDQICSLLEGLANEAFSGLRRFFKYCHGMPNTFYKTCCVFLTKEFLVPELANSDQYVLFAVCRKNAQLNRSSQNDLGFLTLGVPFHEITGDHMNNALWAEPPVSQDEMACIEDSMKDLPPRFPIIPPSGGSLSESSSSRAELMKQLANDFDGNYPTYNNEPTKIIDYFIKDNLVNAKKIQAIIAAGKECKIIKRITNITRENVADSPNHLGGYRISFECFTGETLNREQKRYKKLESQQQIEENNTEDSFK